MDGIQSPRRDAHSFQRHLPQESDNLQYQPMVWLVAERPVRGSGPPSINTERLVLLRIRSLLARLGHLLQQSPDNK